MKSDDSTERRQPAEEALRESEQRFGVMFRRSPLAKFWSRVPEGTIEDVSDAWVRLTGIPREEAIGKTADAFGLVDLEVRRRFHDDLRAHGVVEREWTLATRGNGRRTVFVRAEVVAFRGKTYVLGAMQDVTERKLAEEALRASEEKHRSVLENMSEGVMLFDPNGNLTYQNPASLRIHGFEPQSDGRIAHDDLPTTWNAWDETGRPITFEEWPVSRVFRRERFQNQVLRVQRAETGREFWGSYNGSPILDRDGQLVLGFITIRDITQQVRAQAALRASEAKFRSVFEQAAIGMGRVRFSDARWIDVNDAFCRMLGRSHEEMLSTPWPDITHPDDLELDLVPFRRMAAGELDSYTLEKRFIHADGHEVWARLALSLVRDGSGSPEYEIAIIEDIGDRKRAEDALREANQKLREVDRRKNEFLGMLSHELRNPLAPIRNSLYILDHAEPTGQQARRARDVMGRQVGHLTRLVDDLLDVTRIERGKIELRRADLDLGALARRTADDYRALMLDRGLDLSVEAPAAAIVVNGDEVRLAQVLGNLLSNAAKFTPAGGRVSLAVDAQEGRAVVRVRDTGPGIAPEVLPTIFEPFIQAKQTLARSEGGLGLGLALVKGLVELHGGEIGVASDGAGRGAEFVVRFPLAPGASRAPARGAPEAHQPTASGRRVLVVDDNRDAAESLSELVRMLGYDAETAFDGPSAVAKAVASSPDVVLCDIGLPGMDGYAVARALRVAHEGRIRLVAVSGYAQAEDQERARQAGFDAHLAKPVNPATIDTVLSPEPAPRP